MNFEGNVDRAAAIFSSSNLSFLGRNKMPIDVWKLWVLLELCC